MNVLNGVPGPAKKVGKRRGGRDFSGDRIRGEPSKTGWDGDGGSGVRFSSCRFPPPLSCYV